MRIKDWASCPNQAKLYRELAELDLLENKGSAVSNGVLDASPYLSLFDREPAGDRVSLRPDYDYHAFDLETHDERREAMEKMVEKARKGR